MHPDDRICRGPQPDLSRAIVSTTPDYRSLDGSVARQELANLKERQERLSETKVRVQARQMQLELRLHRIHRELEQVSEQVEILLGQRPDLTG